MRIMLRHYLYSVDPSIRRFMCACSVPYRDGCSPKFGIYLLHSTRYKLCRCFMCLASCISREWKGKERKQKGEDKIMLKRKWGWGKPNDCWEIFFRFCMLTCPAFERWYPLLSSSRLSVKAVAVAVCPASSRTVVVQVWRQDKRNHRLTLPNFVLQ